MGQGRPDPEPVNSIKIPVNTINVGLASGGMQQLADELVDIGSIERNATNAWEQVTHKEDIRANSEEGMVLIPYHAVLGAGLQGRVEYVPKGDDSFCVPESDGPDIEGVAIFIGNVMFEHSGGLYTWDHTDVPWPVDSNGDPVSPDTINVYYDGVKYVAPKYAPGNYGDPNFATCPIGVAAWNEQGQAETYTVSMMMPDVATEETHHVVISGNFPLMPQTASGEGNTPVPGR